MVDYRNVFCNKNEAEVVCAINKQTEDKNISVESLSGMYLQATWFFNQNAKKNGDNSAWIGILRKIRPMFGNVNNVFDIERIADVLLQQVNAEKSGYREDLIDCIGNLIRVARVEAKR